jgi:hypothetical protein
MRRMLLGDVHSDVVLVSAEKEELRAHMSILAAHSEVKIVFFKI